MIGDRIKYYLKEKGISQAELARRVGKDRGNLGNILKSDNMGVQTVVQIAEALNVPISTFFEEDEKNNIVQEPPIEYNKKPLFLEERIEALENELSNIKKKLDL